MRENPVKIYRIKGTDELVKIYADDSNDSPREWSNLGRIVSFHRRYRLSDKSEEDLKSDSFNGWKELEDYLIKERDAGIVLPLRMYDHSGISLSVESKYPFNDVWDSGQVGFIYATNKDIKSEGVSSDKVIEILKGEIATYNQYLEGDVFGFVRIKEIKCECCSNIDEENVDSCWGFYGSDIEENGMLDHLGLKFSELEKIEG